MRVNYITHSTDDRVFFNKRMFDFEYEKTAANISNIKVEQYP